MCVIYYFWINTQDMNTEQHVSKLIKQTYWIFALNIMTIVNFSRYYFYNKTQTNLDKIFSIPFFEMVAQFITTYILFRVLRSYYRLRAEQEQTKLEQEMGIIVLYYRINKAFLRDFKGNDVKLPTETDEQFWWRTPEGLYIKYLINEYNELRELLSINFKNKTIEEIETILKKYYTDDFIANFITT